METTTREEASAWRSRLAECLAADGPLDIVEASLIVAGEEYTDLDISHQRERLQAMGAECCRRVYGLDNPFARLDRIREYLFEELAFHGNREDRHDPRNSFLNEVLNRRVGIPVTLSIIFMEVAEAAGFECRGILLPGHFIARVDDEARTILVDPFHGGQVVTEEDCLQLTARSTGRPHLFDRELLEGTTAETTLLHILRNLKRAYLAREDFPRTLDAVDRILMVSPYEPGEIRDRGILLASLGDPASAITDLETYLSLEPRAPDLESVQGRLKHLRKRMS